jgi:hypothetical protein
MARWEKNNDDLQHLNFVINCSIEVDMIGPNTSGDTELQLFGLKEQEPIKIRKQR